MTDLELVEARWRVGYIRTSELPGVADELRAAGLDAPALAQLAAGTADPGIETRTTFERALREVGAGAMSAAEAVAVLARHFAGALLAGAISPRAGAKAIALLRWRGGPAAVELVLPFERLDCEYEEVEESRVRELVARRRLDRAVRGEARKLLER